jgi:hypothetical protein
MKYIVPVILGVLLLVLSFLCPFLVILTLPFIKWDKQPTDGVIRGDLPKWLSWFSTPDERLPGGMYEPTVKKIYDKYGKWFTSWYWLGVRNCLMTLAVRLGKPTTDYIPETPLGFWERGDIWRYSCTLGPIKFVTGYQVYKVLDRSFQAAPVFTLKRY